MKKRILSMLVVAMVFGTLLVGCGKDAATQSEQTNEVSAKTDEVVKQPEESTEQILQEDATEVTVPMETELAKIPEETTKSENKEETTVTAPQYTYTDLSANMYAKSSVNVRDLPDTVGNKLGGLATSQSVKVTGQCNETGWYRIDYNGTVAYVSDKYIVADKPVVEAAQKPVEQPISGEQLEESSDYPDFQNNLYEVIFDGTTFSWYTDGNPDGYQSVINQISNIISSQNLQVEGTPFDWGSDSKDLGQYKNKGNYAQGDWMLVTKVTKYVTFK